MGGDVAPAIERVQFKMVEMKRRAQLQERQREEAREKRGGMMQGIGAKKSIDKNGSGFLLDEAAMRRLAICEITRIPVKVVERRLQGLGERLVRHLSPKRT